MSHLENEDYKIGHAYLSLSFSMTDNEYKPQCDVGLQIWPSDSMTQNKIVHHLEVSSSHLFIFSSNVTHWSCVSAPIIKVSISKVKSERMCIVYSILVSWVFLEVGAWIWKRVDLLREFAWSWFLFNSCLLMFFLHFLISDFLRFVCLSCYLLFCLVCSWFS